jgi:hypothetical protein
MNGDPRTPQDPDEMPKDAPPRDEKPPVKEAPRPDDEEGTGKPVNDMPLDKKIRAI